MKHCLFLLIFIFYCTVCVFSQTTLQEFVIEKDDNPPSQIFYKNKGCTPDVGVIVFYTTIPDLKFSMPDTPNRLKNVSTFDKENNCYVLCVQPTDTRIGGIAQYSIAITGAGYKPIPALMVNSISPGITQYFNIKLKDDWKSAYESLKKEIDKLKGGNGEAVSVNEPKPAVPVTPTTPFYSAMSWYQEGVKNSNTGNKAEAIRCYKKALDMNSDMSDAWSGLADVYFSQYNYKDAVECYEKVMGKNPSEQMWNNLGISYNHLRQYEKAVNCFENSLKINANNDVTWYNLGIAYEQVNKISVASACYQTAAQLGNKFALLLLKGENGGVVDSIEQKPITSVTPTYSAMSWFQEGVKNSNAGNNSEAILNFSKALDMNPNMSDAWYNLGIAYGREKNISYALECYQKAAQLGNKDAKKLLSLMGKKW